MRDSLVQTTIALGSAATINSPAIGLGHDAQQTAVGTPLHNEYEMEVYYPQNPTGTAPTVQATIQDTLDGSTWVSGPVVHTTDSATTGFPKNQRTRFITRPKAMAVRVQFVVGGTTPNYGTATCSLAMGGRYRG